MLTIFCTEHASPSFTRTPHTHSVGLLSIQLRTANVTSQAMLAFLPPPQHSISIMFFLPCFLFQKRNRFGFPEIIPFLNPFFPPLFPVFCEV